MREYNTNSLNQMDYLNSREEYLRSVLSSGISSLDVNPSNSFENADFELSFLDGNYYVIALISGPSYRVTAVDQSGAYIDFKDGDLIYPESPSVKAVVQVSDIDKLKRVMASVAQEFTELMITAELFSIEQQKSELESEVVDEATAIINVGQVRDGSRRRKKKSDKQLAKELGLNLVEKDEAVISSTGHWSVSVYDDKDHQESTTHQVLVDAPDSEQALSKVIDALPAYQELFPNSGIAYARAVPSPLSIEDFIEQNPTSTDLFYDDETSKLRPVRVLPKSRKGDDVLMSEKKLRRHSMIREDVLNDRSAFLDKMFKDGEVTPEVESWFSTLDYSPVFTVCNIDSEILVLPGRITDQESFKDSEQGYDYLAEREGTKEFTVAADVCAMSVPGQSQYLDAYQVDCEFIEEHSDEVLMLVDDYTVTNFDVENDHYNSDEFDDTLEPDEDDDDYLLNYAFDDDMEESCGKTVKEENDDFSYTNANMMVGAPEDDREFITAFAEKLYNDRKNAIFTVVTINDSDNYIIPGFMEYRADLCENPRFARLLSAKYSGDPYVSVSTCFYKLTTDPEFEDYLPVSYECDCLLACLDSLDMICDSFGYGFIGEIDNDFYYEQEDTTEYNYSDEVTDDFSYSVNSDVMNQSFAGDSSEEVAEGFLNRLVNESKNVTLSLVSFDDLGPYVLDGRIENEDDLLANPEVQEVIDSDLLYDSVFDVATSIITIETDVDGEEYHPTAKELKALAACADQLMRVCGSEEPGFCGIVDNAADRM